MIYLLMAYFPSKIRWNLQYLFIFLILFPITNSPSATKRALPNHVVVKRERGDVHGHRGVLPNHTTTTTTTAAIADLDDRVIISDVKETVISVNNLGGTSIIEIFADALRNNIKLVMILDFRTNETLELSEMRCTNENPSKPFLSQVLWPNRSFQHRPSIESRRRRPRRRLPHPRRRRPRWRCRGPLRRRPRPPSDPSYGAVGDGSAPD